MGIFNSYETTGIKKKGIAIWVYYKKIACEVSHATSLCFHKRKCARYLNNVAFIEVFPTLIDNGEFGKGFIKVFFQ